MLKLFDGVRDLGFGAVALRTVIACLCGTVIGLERSSKNRPAGLRTHILVCLGATVAAMTGLFIFLELQLPTDISRLSGQVISGLECVSKCRKMQFRVDLAAFQGDFPQA